jgi:hypothetical protein
VERLRERSSELWKIVRYEDLISDPDRIVRKIYGWLDLEISSGLEEALSRVGVHADGQKSNQSYTLQEVGLTRELILREYREVFEAFDFDPQKEKIVR